MSEATAADSAGETTGRVVVRYWAAARAAAGVESDTLAVDGETSLDRVLEQVRITHRDRPRFKDVLGVCSILVGDRPVGARDPAAVVVRPGDTVELLPPFAGG
ncbi:MAG: MoaD/ThiS family protein [Actinomycetes bacterium]